MHTILTYAFTTIGYRFWFLFYYQGCTFITQKGVCSLVGITKGVSRVYIGTQSYKLQKTIIIIIRISNVSIGI